MSNRNEINGMSKSRYVAIEILSSLSQTEKLKNEKWYDAEDTVTDIIDKWFITHSTGRICNRCGSDVLKSDNPEYSFQCLNCDEDLYRFETSLETEKSEGME